MPCYPSETSGRPRWTPRHFSLLVFDPLVPCACTWVLRRRAKPLRERAKTICMHMKDRGFAHRAADGQAKNWDVYDQRCTCFTVAQLKSLMSFHYPVGAPATVPPPTKKRKT